MRPRCWSIHRDERGATLAFVAVIIFVLLGVLALSADFGALYVDRRRMVSAANCWRLNGADSGSAELGKILVIARTFTSGPRYARPEVQARPAPATTRFARLSACVQALEAVAQPLVHGLAAQLE